MGSVPLGGRGPARKSPGLLGVARFIFGQAARAAPARPGRNLKVARRLWRVRREAFAQQQVAMPRKRSVRIIGLNRTQDRSSASAMSHALSQNRGASVTTFHARVASVGLVTTVVV